ncbi:MAG TPA: beta-ketoacyl synthase N-terminal-like domain-containing protein, partial [Ruminiclostridium sp.]|nr:beta-ketoacyl synthase N-terminal-like domain-containing protein [Ruminiclostridium sp.]
MTPQVTAGLKEYELHGGEVHYCQTDVSDLKDTEQCFAKLQCQFGKIHGIFHLAGTIRDSFIFRKKSSDIISVFDPKIKGINNLDWVTRDWNLDVFCIFSSITSIAGNRGQADYAYANRYLDEFAQRRNSQMQAGLRSGWSYSINWPLWEQGGMQVTQSIKERIRTENGMEILKDHDGMDMMERILSANYYQVLPLKGDHRRIKDSFTDINLYSSCEDQLQDEFAVEEHVESKVAPDIAQNKTVDTVQNAAQNKQARIVDDLLKMFSKTLKIDIAGLDIEEDLEAYGFDSLMMVEVLSKLEALYKISVDPSIINQYKTIQNIAGYLCSNVDIQEPEVKEVNKEVKDTKGKRQQNTEIEVKSHRYEDLDGKIAVIGMACRFPQSRSVEEYWDNLFNERDLITEVPKDRWDVKKYFDPEMKRKDSTYSKWGGFIQDIDAFDAAFWGIPDEVAVVMDPQHRILLELVEELWSRSSYTREQIKGKNVGVFIGAGESSYLKNNLDKVPKESMKYIVANTIPNIIAARISDTYDLKGPSLTLDTACSSSLVSIHEACLQIKSGLCDMAIAGGIQVLLDPIEHIGMGQAGVLSKEKEVYVFDERAKGIIIGEGAGVVLLKPLKNAIEDGDNIQAVLLGSSTNNDGHTMGLTTPNIEAQKAVIKQALINSKVTPDTISYFEAHGTGTLLGDPIEVRAATQIYREFSDNVQYCGVGSVKANIGHLMRAAGVASFIKVILSMQKGVMLKTIHCEKPHPRFNFPASPFYPVTEKREWTGIDGHRRAGISSFGFGGTNCHVIL